MAADACQPVQQLQEVLRHCCRASIHDASNAHADMLLLGLQAREHQCEMGYSCLLISSGTQPDMIDRMLWKEETFGRFMSQAIFSLSQTQKRHINVTDWLNEAPHSSHVWRLICCKH